MSFCPKSTCPSPTCPIPTCWIDNPHDKFGLYIALKGLDGKDVDEDSIEMEIVTQAKSKHSPLLVLFCQEGTHKKQFAGMFFYPQSQ